MSGRALTRAHEDILFVVGQHEPVPVAEIARHLLVDEAWVRSRTRTLENRGLLGRQYTGLYGAEQFAHTLTREGAEAIPDDYVEDEDG